MPAALAPHLQARNSVKRHPIIGPTHTHSQPRCSCYVLNKAEPPLRVESRIAGRHKGALRTFCPLTLVCIMHIISPSPERNHVPSTPVQTQNRAWRRDYEERMRERDERNAKWRAESPDGKTAVERAIQKIEAPPASAPPPASSSRPALHRPARQLNALAWNLSQQTAGDALQIIDRLLAAEPARATFPINVQVTNLQAARLAARWAAAPSATARWTACCSARWRDGRPCAALMALLAAVEAEHAARPPVSAADEIAFRAWLGTVETLAAAKMQARDAVAANPAPFSTYPEDRGTLLSLSQNIQAPGRTPKTRWRQPTSCPIWCAHPDR